MTDIRSLINRPSIQEFAVTVRQRHRSPIAEFLAPTVPVPPNFQVYKEWGVDEQQPLYQSRRAMGHPPLQLPLFEYDETRQSQPHGLMAIVDRVYLDGSDEQSVFMLKQAIETIAIESERAREVNAVTEARRLAGAGESIAWGPNDDPIELIDLQIMALMKQARCSHVSVLFGAAAFHAFKHHPKVKPSIPGGLTHKQHPGLFHNEAPFMPLFGIENNPEAGGDRFVMSNSILIFARTPHPTPNSRDWLKSFELTPELQKPNIQKDANPHDIMVSLDWEASITRTNESGVIRLNLPG